LIGHQPLEPAVLIFELFETLGLVEFHPAVLALPAVIGPLADPVLADQFRQRQAALGLFENRDNLFFAESLPFHLGSLWLPPLYRPRLTLQTVQFQGGRSAPPACRDYGEDDTVFQRISRFTNLGLEHS